MMENKMFNNRIKFQQELIVQILTAISRLGKLLQSEKVKKNPKTNTNKKAPDVI